MKNNRNSETAENVEGYLETILDSNKSELQILLRAAEAKNDPVYVTLLTDYFCNIYFMRNEDLSESEIRRSIMTDFRFHSVTDSSFNVFIDNFENRIAKCYLK
ncbi:hypothetical protein GCM10023092_06260 [Rurimicrobium arvi]|uniref:Uncharacterized protein n=1 Tax=Rurimicrobium arvi TaxID=2049916 RepID=A0ABP8MJB0_9BACT